METPPGAQGQADWTEEAVDIGDASGSTKLHAFVLEQSHSRTAAVDWSRSMDQLSWHRYHNAAERMLRPIAMGRRNWTFLGSDVGGETASILFSVLGSARLHEFEPWAYLWTMLERAASGDRGGPGGAATGPLDRGTLRAPPAAGSQQQGMVTWHGLPADWGESRGGQAKSRSPPDGLGTTLTLHSSCNRD